MVSTCSLVSSIRSCSSGSSVLSIVTSNILCQVVLVSLGKCVVACSEVRVPMPRRREEEEEDEEERRGNSLQSAMFAPLGKETPSGGPSVALTRIPLRGRSGMVCRAQ